jgi:hypothetical protein
LGVLAAFWLATAFMSLGPGWDIGIGLLHEGGVYGLAAPLTVVAGALADSCIGIAIAFRRTARPALYAALVLAALRKRMRPPVESRAALSSFMW